jgi:multiple sugar transport system ATP-binding protein
VETADGMLKARVPADMPLRTGESVGISFNAQRLSLFEKASGRAILTSARDNAREAAHG